MATRYFGGNSLAAFIRSSNTITESNAGGRFNALYVPCSIALPSMIGYIQTTPFSATGTIWLRFDVFTAGGLQNASGDGPTLNGSLGPIFRFICVGVGTAAGTYRPQYWNGAAWTNTGADFIMTNSSVQTVAVKIVLGSGFDLYVAGGLVSSGSGWANGITQAINFQLRSMNHQTTVNYSEVMIADYDLRDSHLKDPLLNGNSTANVGAASGVFTDVNEIVLDEATAISIQTAGNKAGQTHTAITVPVGYIIAAMVVNARGRVSGSGVGDGRLGVRSGGTNYSSANRSYNAGYEPRSHIVASDPATGVPFTQAGFNAAEPYLEAS